MEERFHASGSTVGAPVDCESDLAGAIRKIAACLLLKKDPPLWETVMQYVYFNPSSVKPSFVRYSGVAVKPAAEKALPGKLINTPMLDRRSRMPECMRLSASSLY